jgi:hypothetical protein
MAYDANTDYQALKNTLYAKLAATTDAAEKQAIQQQIAAADQSRIEKGASNLYGLGQYYNDADKGKIAGLMAEQSVGNAFDLQKRNATDYFNQTKQNASNEALSRGMARSSFVQDRMSNIDTKAATALADIDSSKLTAVYNAKNDILNDYRTYQDKKAAEEKKDFINTTGAYYNDYQAEINKLTNDGDASNNWKIPYLQQARQEKILGQQQAAQKASGGGSGGGGSGSGKTATFAQMNSDMDSIYKMNLDPVNDALTNAGKQALINYASQYGGTYAAQLLAPYGLSHTAPAAPKTPTGGNNYSAVKSQAQTFLSQIGVGGGGSSTIQDVTSHLANAVDSGKISQQEAVQIMRELGLAR